MCGEHDFHVDKGDGQFLRLERPCGEQFVKVCRGYYFRAFGTTCEQMFQDASKEARTVCGQIKPKIDRKAGVPDKGKDPSITKGKTGGMRGEVNTSLQQPFLFRTRPVESESAPCSFAEPETPG